jgi:Ca2+-binding EF-hand superfamily protein
MHARHARSRASESTNSRCRASQKKDGKWDLPGDLSHLDNIGLAEGQGIWDRMAAIIRRQRLDVRILLDAHDRRNAGVVDIDTFRRALCYAFGNHWTELQMTSDEFDEVTKPYITRNPNRPGDPPGFIFWQKFSTDLQTLADRRSHSDDFMQRLVKIEAKERVAAQIQRDFGITELELRDTFTRLKQTLNTHGGGGSQGALTFAFRRMDTDHSGTVRAEEIKHFLQMTQRGLDNLNMKVIEAIVDMCDKTGDGEVDYAELSKFILCDDILELLALVPDKSVKDKNQAYKNSVIGSRGVTVTELQQAQKAIKEKLLLKHKNVSAALRAIDTKGDGFLERDEIIEALRKYGLIKHVDYYTGAMMGEVTMAQVDTLMDFVDNDKDGKLNYNEFTRVIVAEDIMHIPAPRSANHVVRRA